jgi:hypothetical protein
VATSLEFVLLCFQVCGLSDIEEVEREDGLLQLNGLKNSKEGRVEKFLLPQRTQGRKLTRSSAKTQK